MEDMKLQLGSVVGNPKILGIEKKYHCSVDGMNKLLQQREVERLVTNRGILDKGKAIVE